MVNIRPLSKELAKMAKTELNEVPDRIGDDIKALREWLTMQAHLKPIQDDQLLVTFLRGCKYSLEKTKQKLDTYFTIKTSMPELLSNRDPTTDKVLLEIIRLGLFVVLPSTDKPDGPKVLLVRMCVYKQSQFDVNKIIKVYTMIADILTRDNDNYAISGQMLLCDLTNVGWGQLLEFEPSLIKKFFTMLQDAMPARLKGIHYYRPPTGFETFVNLVRGFLSEKNKERLTVHGDNIETVYKYIPQKMLPAEYGGKAGPIQDLIDDWEKKIVANKDYFNEMEKQGTDESRRQIVQEVIGSFRKLDVD